MTRQRQWLVVLLWGAAGCFGQQATAVGQDLLVANNTASFNESILRFSVTGECLGNFAQPPSRSGPVGLAFDPTGNLYVANHSNNSIHRYSRTGADLGVFATAGLNMPTGLAFNRLGQLVVCNYGDGSLSFFSPTGTWLARVNTGLLHPLALALDACDNIFVSTPNIGANSGVFRFAPSGTLRTLFAAGIDLDPRGLAFDREGNLYVANQHGSSVRRYSAEGTFLDTFAATGLRDPFALAFDACGDLYVSNQAGATIRRYSACGEDLGIFATLPSPLANPVGLAFLPVPEPTAPVLLILSAGIIGLIANQRRPAPSRRSPAHEQRMN